MPRRSANFPTTVNGQEAKSKKGSCGTRATKKSRDAFKGKVTKDLESMRILCLVPPLYHSGVTVYKDGDKGGFIPYAMVEDTLNSRALFRFHFISRV
eukprot:CAMPEP_0168747860 /NCGR_PEP_ID=MMETSP0724-20121128/15875_1 /TAXON_ID=265536 /ORGANISM="Amphiprora sp., Strain CCMP467" /LENGTH=96 /DNA_ID=CAMNT_0008795665 /DNA_START=16 /DNA_END=306 /DNA_ORIENTATION=+